jgi:hypothetical protein
MYEAFLSAYDDFMEGELFQIETKEINLIERTSKNFTCKGFIVGKLPCFLIREKGGDMYRISYISSVKAGPLNGIIVYSDYIIDDINNSGAFEYEKTKENIEKFFNRIKEFKNGIGGELITSCCKRIININQFGRYQIDPFGKSNLIVFSIDQEIMDISENIKNVDFILRRSNTSGFSLKFIVLRKNSKTLINKLFVTFPEHSGLMPNGKKITQEALLEYANKISIND